MPTALRGGRAREIIDAKPTHGCGTQEDNQLRWRPRVRTGLAAEPHRWTSPGLSVFHRSPVLLSLLSGVPMGPKLEKGMELWLCVGGELGRLLGLEE